jgi:hypothetical protein
MLRRYITEGDYYDKIRWVARPGDCKTGFETDEALCLWKWEGSARVSRRMSKLKGETLLSLHEIKVFASLNAGKVTLFTRTDQFIVTLVNPTAYTRLSVRSV